MGDVEGRKVENTWGPHRRIQWWD